MKRIFPTVFFVSVALASLVMAGFAYFSTQEATRFKFEATADDALNRIEGSIDLRLSLLHATHALFEARGGDISRTEFKSFFDALDFDKNYGGLRGIGFLDLAKRGSEAEVEQDIVRNHGATRGIYPISDLNWRTPIVLFEPLNEDTKASIGYDMFTDADRRAAIEAALASGDLKATKRVMLGQSTGQVAHPGFIVFEKLDVLKQESGGASPVMATRGLLYAAFRSNDLFSASLGKSPLLPVNVEVYDGSAQPDNLLFRSETPPDTHYDDDLLVARNLTVGGRQWTILFRPTAMFTPPASSAIPIMLGVFGLMLASAIAMIARYQDQTYDAISLLQSSTEKSLFEKDLMLQEMKHRIKNSIARMLAIARQTAANSASIEEFSTSFGARLQAMAASQDMLTRSRWQKADLAELLHTELEQVFGQGIDRQHMSGPAVQLNETTTQALGLTFHELATNALKYGEAAGLGGSLTVKWTVETSGQDTHLLVTWTEKGKKPVVAPEKTGFGTKLIDMNITRELGGRISREYRQDGLSIVLDIPLAEATGKVGPRGS